MLATIKNLVGFSHLSAKSEFERHISRATLISFLILFGHILRAQIQHTKWVGRTRRLTKLYRVNPVKAFGSAPADPAAETKKHVAEVEHGLWQDTALQKTAMPI